jgi:ABC-type multidrug transport system ATPase subunit
MQIQVFFLFLPYKFRLVNFLFHLYNYLYEALFKYAGKNTLLVITHWLDHIDRYDRIFVLQGGKIIEQGHINELRKNQNKSGFINFFIGKNK